MGSAVFHNLRGFESHGKKLALDNQQKTGRDYRLSTDGMQKIAKKYPFEQVSV